MSDPIVMTQDDGIAKVILNRPAAFNAFGHDRIEHLARHIVMLAVDHDVRECCDPGRGDGILCWGSSEIDVPIPTRPVCRLSQVIGDLASGNTGDSSDAQADHSSY